MTNVNQHGGGRAVVRSLTIQINNSSSGDVGVGSGQLTGGNWEGKGPVPGTVISAGGDSYVNAADNIFTALGGAIQLAPASGGSINITWMWPQGMGVTGSTSSNSLNGLSVTSSVINQQTNNPTLQVYITNTAALLKALEQAAKY